ncbi:MAG: STAS domain-containing protein [Haliscomenobacter sp.]|nr:STAS domain-containing protein [Haliscomenobacter sp.]MBK7475100.1 STAS domain-containing protein [Haliscomenobacter sp.]
MRYNLKEFTPKLVTLIKEGIGKEQLFKDISSGVIVGIVALPLAIAFAIASGVSPEKGLVTAVVGGFLISALGGSKVQIGGPTGAFIVIVYGIVQQYGFNGLVISTFLAGFIIILLGLARLGNLLKFIPHSLIVGFTSGIAIIIFTSQIKDFLGLQTGALPAGFLDKWKTFFQNIQSVNFYAVGVALVTILVTQYTKKITTRVPGPFLAILVGTLGVLVFQLPVETISSKFGQISGAIPAPKLPKVDFETIQHLIEPAFAIALLGAIESLLSAAVADGMIGGRHRSNMELVAQGIANIASALFGGIPATGAIARTATNVKNGGRTPIAGITHAVTLLLIMLVFAPYAKLIPLSCLAGILIVVAYNMGEWHSFGSVLRSNRYDALILLTTFFLTVFFDLVIAIEIGVVLSSFVFMKRMSDIAQFNILEDSGEQAQSEESPALPPGVLIYEINSPLFFGVAQRFQETLSEINVKPKKIIIRMRFVPFIDATGIYRLKELIHSYQNRNIDVVISEPGKEVLRTILSNEIIHRSKIAGDIESAIQK